MLPYYCLILLPAMAYYVRIKQIKLDAKKRAIATFFALLTLLVALRAVSIGNDTANYRHYFEKFSAMTWSGVLSASIETGFAVLNKLVSLVTDNFQIFLAICAVISIIPICVFYCKESENSFLTIALFMSSSLFIMLFSGVRQSIAIALCVISFQYVKKRKLLPYAVCLALAILIHRSAIVAIPLYFIYHLRIKKVHLLFLIPVIAAVFVFNRPIFNFLLSFLYMFEGSVQETGAYTMLLVYAFFLLVSFVFVEDKDMDKDSIGLRNILIAIVILQLFAPINTLAMRMNYYYIVFFPIIVPKLLHRSSERWRKIAVPMEHALTLFFLVYFFIAAPAVNALHTFPYHFFWGNV